MRPRSMATRKARALGKWRALAASDRGSQGLLLSVGFSSSLAWITFSWAQMRLSCCLMSSAAVRDVLMAVGFSQHHLSP